MIICQTSIIEITIVTIRALLGGGELLEGTVGIALTPG